MKTHNINKGQDNSPAAKQLKAERIALGFELMKFFLPPNTRSTASQIAAWCGCSKSVIQTNEWRAMRKLKERMGHDPVLREVIESVVGRVNRIPVQHPLRGSGGARRYPVEASRY